MSKSHSFSIYLLKDGFNADNALKAEHSLEAITECDQLPEGLSLYVLDSPPTPPWWRAYFGIEKTLLQALKAAVVFVPVDDRTFAITFGHVSHNLLDTSYEYDFGLKVTLNSLDPEKLKSTDVLMPNGAKRQRTQVPVDSDLTYFDFDQDSTILKSLTGKVRAEYAEFFKHATGASNIRISSDVTPDSIPALCEKLLELYRDETYKTNFPHIQNVSPVRDPVIVDALNAKLVAGLQAKDDNLALAVPEMVDYRSGLWAIFAGAGPSLVYDDVFIGQYYDYLDRNGVTLSDVSVEALKKHLLIATDEDGIAGPARHSVFKSLIYDTTLNAAGDTYHLCEGHWYLVENSFVDRLTNYLDPLCATSGLPSYTHDDEGTFNKDAAAGNGELICLDRSNIAPPGQKQVEPCDLYELAGDRSILHHVKVSTLSSQLSHLFNQGINSIHLLRDEDSARASLKSLVAADAPAARVNEFCLPIEQDRLGVSYDIVTHKDPTAKSRNLPLFSRISLMRAMKELKRMGVPATFAFIKDETVAGAAKKKLRKPRRKTEAPPVQNTKAEAA